MRGGEPVSPDDVPTSSPRGGGRILREARAAAGITHPNAVSIYDVGEVDGVPFLAMELVSGKTIRKTIGDPAIPLARRLRWLVDVARALGAAHKLGVIHRDIKPENVMVRDDGLVKVLDFGIARREPGRTGAKREALPKGPIDRELLEELAIASGTLTAEGAVVGTPMYMAPEQMLGSAIDGRTDQFAWGVLAHELLSGKVPWEGTGLSVVSEILSKDVAPLTHAFPEIPRGVDLAVRRALSKEPGARFLTMEDVADALEPFTAPASGGGGSGKPPPAISLASALPFTLWENVFVVVDNGQGVPADYPVLGEIVMAEAAKHGAGIGALIIIPPDATPPSEGARAAMHAILKRLGPSLRCACWIVEGGGFQGAMVRVVINSIRLVSRLPYPSQVMSDLTAGLTWTVERLGATNARIARVPEGVRWIQEERRRAEARASRGGSR